MKQNTWLMLTILLNISTTHYIKTASSGTATTSASSWSSRLSAVANSLASGAKKTGTYLAEKSKGITVEGTLNNIQKTAQATRDTAQAIRQTKEALKALQDDMLDASNDLTGSIFGDNVIVNSPKNLTTLDDSSWLTADDDQEVIRKKEVTAQELALKKKQMQLAKAKELAEQLQQQLEEKRRLEAELQELETQEVLASALENAEEKDVVTEEEQLLAAQERALLELKKELEARKSQLLKTQEKKSQPTSSSMPIDRELITTENPKATRTIKPVTQNTKVITINNNSPYSITISRNNLPTTITLTAKNSKAIKINTEENTTINFAYTINGKKNNTSITVNATTNTITINYNTTTKKITLTQNK